MVVAIAGIFVWGATLAFKLIRSLFHGSGNLKNTFTINNSSVSVPLPPSQAATSYNAPSSTSATTQPETLPAGRYSLKGTLITEAEKNFLTTLKQVVGDRYRIELQVQLSRIVTPTDSNEHFTNYRDFNQIKAKSIDFVLYDKEYRPYLCIELDDRSHLRWDRMKRDAFVDEIMKSVGLRIIHIPAAYSYDIDALREEIFQDTMAESAA